MSRRYDSRTTTFSPEGRLYQVEYALEAINNASSTLGILATDGVVLAADKMVSSKLLDHGRAKEKLYKVENHVMCAVAGLTADANILINQARINAQRFLYQYGEPQPIEQLVVQLCDVKQSYTQFGGLRPFGVSFLFAGWDKHHGFQLYHTDPSGNYSGWKATAIGVNNQSAQTILKQELREDMDVAAALDLAAKVLNKTMDTAAPSADKLEVAVLQFDPENPTLLIQRSLPSHEIEALMKRAQEQQAEAQ